MPPTLHKIPCKSQFTLPVIYSYTIFKNCIVGAAVAMRDLPIVPAGAGPAHRGPTRHFQLTLSGILIYPVVALLKDFVWI
jgi:hypothetical protein